MLDRPLEPAFGLAMNFCSSEYFLWFWLFLIPLQLSSARADEATSTTAEQNTSRDRPGWYQGRRIAPTMSADGADWLTRSTREREEQPQKLLSSLQLEPGMRVGDFGCGNGFYTLQLAQRVGPRGRIFAIDIQPEMLELLQARAEPRGLGNIEPVLATADDPRLPAGQLDLVLMVDVYHELDDPELVLRAVRQSLRPQGRLVLVEFRTEDPAVPILPLHKMSQPQVLKELAANQFKLVGQFDELPWQHVLFFAPSGSQRPLWKLKPWASTTDEPVVQRVDEAQSPGPSQPK